MALRTKEILEGHMLKWAKALFKYNNIIYIKDIKNVLSNLLSREFLVHNLQSPNPNGLYSGKTRAAAANNAFRFTSPAAYRCL